MVIGLVAGLFLLAVIFVVWSVGVNSRLVRLNDAADAQWNQVQRQHQRLLKLTRDLVSVVHGSAGQEAQVITRRVGELANASKIPTTPSNSAELQQFAETQRQLRNALTSLLLEVERLPGMRTDQGFLSLKTKLEDTERQVALERKKFNEAVRDYNTAVRQFPAVLVSSLHNLKKRPSMKAGITSESSDTLLPAGAPGGNSQEDNGSPPQDAQSVPPPPMPAPTPDRNLPPEGNLRLTHTSKALAMGCTY